MALFGLKFLLTSILFSLIIGAFLTRWNSNKLYSNLELTLYSLGLGPIFTALMLYYLLLLLPHHSDLFYAGIIFIIYATLFIFSIKGFRIIARGIKEWKTSPLKPGAALYWGFIITLLGLFLFLYVGKTLQTPIEHHDALVYGNLGKMYYHYKEVPYAKLMKATNKGFYFQGSQKPSFSMLLTWEMILNPKKVNFSPGFDLYFRSITGYYGLLVIAVLFLWLYRKSKILALLGILVSLSSLGFVLMVLNYHLDSYRVFFLMVSWIWLAQTIKNGDRFSLILLGIFSGLTAYAHLIGLMVAIANIIAYFIFYQGGFKTRLLRTASLSMIVLSMGNIHYFMEMFYGAVSGWSSYLSGS